MNALGPRHLIAVLATTTIFWLGCAQSTAGQTAQGPQVEPPNAGPQQPGENPNVPRTPPPECKSDAQCTGGEVCDAMIWALCDTCDGGPIIMTCQSPRSCASQRDCPGNRTCDGNVCR
jgi:Cys-rich repeat protein